MKTILIAAIATLFSVSSYAKCIFTRGVVEYGSGNTKAIVAKVNTCASPWQMETIAQFEEPIQYRNNTVIVNGVRFLKESVMKEGIQATSRILGKMYALGVSEVHAIATSVFRDQASDDNGTVNGLIFLNKIKDSFGLNFTILSQYQEAIFASEAALTEISVQNPDFKRENTVIWDIGGGSTQIVLPSSSQGDIEEVILSQYGSATMQEYVNLVLKENIQDYTSSANPVSRENADKLSKFIKKKISERVHFDSIRKMSKRSMIIGIGGVHKYSSCELIYGTAHCTYNTSQLQKAIAQHAGLTDEELYDRGRCLEFKYCRDKITNAVMIKAFLEAIEKTTIVTAKSTSKEGILLSSEFWQK